MLILASTLLLAACSLPRPADVVPDAAPDAAPDRRLKGAMSNLWPGATVTLELAFGNATERLVVPGNGEFVFTSELASGTTYAVTVATAPDHHTCTVTNGSGTAGEAEVAPVLVDCRAADVRLSLPVPFSFAPGTAAYDVPVSMLGQDLDVTVTSQGASAIRIAGTDASTGTSVHVRLPIGLTMIPVEITISGAKQTYAIMVARGAAPMQQVAYVKSPAPDDLDDFGGALSVSGDLLAVGAPWEDSAAHQINGDLLDNSASSAGAVYTYHRQGATWSYDAYLKPDNTDAGDEFGHAVSASGDYVAVGAPYESSASRVANTGESDNSAPAAGAVYIFQHTAIGWSQQAYLKAPNADAGDQFGSAVVLVDDLLLVSAPGEASAATGVGGDQSDNSVSGNGAVYAFRRQGDGRWTLEAYLKSGQPHANDNFGGDSTHAPISSDGRVLEVAASGSSKIWEFTRNGGSWVARGDVFATTPLEGNAAAPAYVDQQLVVVTGEPAIWDYNVWDFSSARKMESPHQLSAPQTAGLNATFLAARGDLVVAGFPDEPGSATGIDPIADANASQAGAAIVFAPIELESFERAYVKASNTDAGDYFGRVLSLSGDSLAVAAWYEDSKSTGVNGDQTNNAGHSCGAVYVYQ
jgi:hypothetical protein